MADYEAQPCGINPRVILAVAITNTDIMLSLMLAGWMNSRIASGSRRHDTHLTVIVKSLWKQPNSSIKIEPPRQPYLTMERQWRMAPF